MFSYNVIIDHHDCYCCPWDFESLKDCLDSVYSEINSCKSNDCVAFVYKGSELFRRVESNNENV